MNKIPCVKCATKILPTTANKFDGLCGPCYTKKIENLEYEKFINTPGCPQCDGSGSIFFRYKESLKSRNDKYNDYIKKTYKLKYGALGQCIVCENFWYADENFGQYFIHKQRVPLLQKWSESKHVLPFKLLLKAFRIRPTPEGFYGGMLKRTEIPCSITTVNNVNYQKALLVITKLPPIYESVENVFFSNQIKEIQESSFALPFCVRKASAAAEEVRMGFFPTVVSSRSGSRIMLNGVCNFYDHLGIKGEDIVLSAKNSISQESFEHYSEVREDIVYFFSDPSWVLRFLRGKQ